MTAEPDPGCAMAHWGVAYASGCNYNKPWEAFREEALREALVASRQALAKARTHLDSAWPVERALIQALVHRYPADALRASDVLRDLVPDAGHLRHMPSHIDVLCGHYYEAVVANGRAVEADDRYLAREGPINFYTLYRCHNHSVTTAIHHYARGIAHAATGRIPEAEAERERFVRAVAGVPETRYVFNNTCTDILAVAGAMLDGELEYRKGHTVRAFEHLRHAVALDDNLPYDEPWGWMQPARHALGALLLEQGRVAEAEQVYRDDRGLNDTLSRASQHPDNVWSLHGLVECLHRQHRHAEAKAMEARLNLAGARADVPITASCFCRLEAS